MVFTSVLKLVNHSKLYTLYIFLIFHTLLLGLKDRKNDENSYVFVIVACVDQSIGIPHTNRYCGVTLTDCSQNHSKNRKASRELFSTVGKLIITRWLSGQIRGVMIAWWRHQMETFPALLAFVRGIHRPPVNSPHKGQRRGALMFSLICAWINAWVNNRETGDLRRYRAHCDVNVIG